MELQRNLRKQHFELETSKLQQNLYKWHMWLGGGLFQQHMELEDERLQQDFQYFNVAHTGLEARYFQNRLCQSQKSEEGKIFPVKQITKRTEDT
jgi:hypothetical protein